MDWPKFNHTHCTWEGKGNKGGGDDFLPSEFFSDKARVA